MLAEGGVECRGEQCMKRIAGDAGMASAGRGLPEMQSLEVLEEGCKGSRAEQYLMRLTGDEKVCSVRKSDRGWRGEHCWKRVAVTAEVRSVGRG